MNHALSKHHNVTYEEINNMYPFERDIKVTLINKDIERETNEGTHFTP